MGKVMAEDYSDLIKHAASLPEEKAAPTREEMLLALYKKQAARDGDEYAKVSPLTSAAEGAASAFGPVVPAGVATVRKLLGQPGSWSDNYSDAQKQTANYMGQNPKSAMAGGLVGGALAGAALGIPLKALSAVPIAGAAISEAPLVAKVAAGAATNYGMNAAQNEAVGAPVTQGGTLAALLGGAVQTAGPAASALAGTRNKVTGFLANKGRQLLAADPELAAKLSSAPKLATSPWLRTPEETMLAQNALKPRGVLATEQLMGPSYVNRTLEDAQAGPGIMQSLAGALNKVGGHSGATALPAEHYSAQLPRVMANNKLGPQSTVSDLLNSQIGTTDLLSNAAGAKNTVEQSIFHDVGQLDPAAQRQYESSKRLIDMFNQGDVSRLGTKGSGGSTPYSMTFNNPAADEVNAINAGRGHYQQLSNRLGAGAAMAGLVNRPLGAALGAAGGAVRPLTSELASGAASMIGRGAQGAGQQLGKFVSPQTAATMMTDAMGPLRKSRSPQEEEMP